MGLKEIVLGAGVVGAGMGLYNLMHQRPVNYYQIPSYGLESISESIREINKPFVEAAESGTASGALVPVGLAGMLYGLYQIAKSKKEK